MPKSWVNLSYFPAMLPSPITSFSPPKFPCLLLSSSVSTAEMDVCEDPAPRIALGAILSSLSPLCPWLDVFIIYLTFWENGWPDGSPLLFQSLLDYLSLIKLTPPDYSWTLPFAKWSLLFPEWFFPPKHTAYLSYPSPFLLFKVFCQTIPNPTPNLIQRIRLWGILRWNPWKYIVSPYLTLDKVCDFKGNNV